MKWKQLPIGEFIKAKRHLKAVGDIIVPLYDAPLTEDAETQLPKAQTEWAAFLAIAAEGVDPARSDVALMSLSQVQEDMAGFFSMQVGSARK
jgi:hypothetical protein